MLHTSLPFVAGYTVRSDYIMKFQRPLGIESAVVTSGQHPNGDAAYELVESFAHWRTPALAGKLPLGVRELTLMRRLQGRVEAAIAEWRPEVVHAHSPMLVGIPALKAARRFQLPLVYELRDLWENPSIDRGKMKEGSLLYRAAQAAENYVLQRADALVSVCRTLSDAIAPRAGAGANLFVVDNGVDVERFTPRAPRPELAARWGLEGKAVLAYLGTFQPYEGVDLLLRALPEVAAAVPNVHLLVVGGGGEQPRLVALARELGIEGRVTFTGRIPHAEVVDVFPLGDLFVYPRLLTHTTALTTPLKPLEAMSMARPVLVSDIPPMREIVAPLGERALTFRPGDRDDLVRALAGALRDRDALARAGAAGRELVVAERVWANLVARYPGIYAAAIERNRRRAGRAAAA